MDFIFELLDRITGPETELVELLPIIVLFAIIATLGYLRSLILKCRNWRGEESDWNKTFDRKSEERQWKSNWIVQTLGRLLILWDLKVS